MQNTFEQVNELIESLEIICKNNSLPLIEKDIVLERLRNLYMAVQQNSVSESSTSQVATDKYEVYQGIQDDVDLFFDTDHESYGKQMDVDEQDAVLQREIEEEERAKAEEAVRRQAEEEQRRREEEARMKAAEEQRQAEERRRQAEEEQRRWEEEARMKAAEEQRRAEERRRQAEEEQRRREEEARLKAAEEQRQAEERRRQAEEEQRRREEEARMKAAEEQRKAEERRRQIEQEQHRREEEARQKAASSKSALSSQEEDDLLQFLPKNNKVASDANISKPLAGTTPQRSLNDLFTAQREDHSLSAQFQNAKVTDLTKAISINDKFTFIKELFNNKGEEFSAAITKLNQCATMDDAVNCLEELKQKFFWDSASTAYLSLCDLVRRKYN